MKVFLDLDGVLVDFVGGVCKLHRIPNPYLDPENLGNYNIQELIGPALNFTRAFWAGLEPLPEMRTIIGLLVAKFDAVNICLLTGSCDGVEGKIDWIKEYLPAWKERFLIGPTKVFCAHENSILFDDSEANIHAFQGAGGRAFLMPALWNARHRHDPVDLLARFLGGL